MFGRGVEIYMPISTTNALIFVRVLFAHLLGFQESIREDRILPYKTYSLGKKSGIMHSILTDKNDHRCIFEY